MVDFLGQTLPEFVGQLSPLTYLLVFLGGVLTSIGPCNISMVPVIVSYVAGQEEVSRRRSFWLAGAFALGSALTFMGLGIVAAEIGMLAGTENRLMNYLAAAVCFLLGLNLLEVVRLNLNFLTRFQPKRVALTGLLGALLLGMIIGLGGSQCGTPVLFAILSVTAAKGKLVQGALLLLSYGLGRGVPVVLAGTFAGVLKSLPRLERWSSRLNKVAGVVLLLVGLYFIFIA